MDNVRPEEIPDGFSAADPTNNGGAGGGGDPQQAQNQAKEGQRRSILEQTLTPEALARLGTIKVRNSFLRCTICSQSWCK